MFRSKEFSFKIEFTKAQKKAQKQSHFKTFKYPHFSFEELEDKKREKLFNTVIQLNILLSMTKIRVLVDDLLGKKEVAYNELVEYDVSTILASRVQSRSLK